MTPGNLSSGDAGRREEILRWAYWLVPAFFCLVLYYHGIRAWYQQDDFVWLGLRYRVDNLSSFLHEVFGPSRHGTFRPLSERLMFLLWSKVWGTDAAPARLCTFITQLANLVVLSAVARRTAGSRVAGFLAPILWIANGALAFPMAWTSAYMEILCAFCLLLAFYCFLRYIETGRRTWYGGQWAAFLVGFGVMESIAVYPAVAAAYALLFARKYLRSTLPLAVVSAAFVVFHSMFVPKQPAGPYSLHLDLSMAKTAATYWQWVLVPYNWGDWAPAKAGWIPPILVLLTAASLIYVAQSAWRRDFLPLFGLSWFGILLAPVLPLKEHMSYYYLTLPAIGISLIGAYAAAEASQRGWQDRIIAGATLLLFLMVQAPYAAECCKWWCLRSRRIENVVVGVTSEQQLFPGKTLVLTGVSDEIFYGAVWDNAFRAFGAPDTYLDPTTLARVRRNSQLGDISRFFLDPAVLQQGLLENKVEVLSAATPLLTDVTPQFEAAAKSAASLAPRRLDLGAASAQPYLSGAWYQLENNHRWSGKSAGVTLAAPAAPDQQLHLIGFCPRAQVAPGPLRGKVIANGQRIGELSLAQGDSGFEAAFKLPPNTVGKPFVDIEIQLDRTFRAPGDGRDLGLCFGTFEIR